MINLSDEEIRNIHRLNDLERTLQNLTYAKAALEDELRDKIIPIADRFGFTACDWIKVVRLIASLINNPVSRDKGIEFTERSKPWRVRVWHKGRRIDVGYYGSLLEANAAHKAAENLLNKINKPAHTEVPITLSNVAELPDHGDGTHSLNASAS